MQSLIEKVQALDDTFKENHYVIADQAEGGAVKTEQDMLDKHKDKVFSHTSRLYQLLENSEHPAAPTLVKDPLLHLRRWMRKVDRESGRINEGVIGLDAESGADQCLLRLLEKRNNGLMSEFTRVVASCC